MTEQTYAGYPGVDPSEAPIPKVPEAFRANAGVPVQQTVAPARPTYGGSSWAAPREFDFQTPSGAWCRIRKIAQEDALTMGLINHLDLFSPELMRDAQGKAKPAAQTERVMLEKLAADGQKSSGFFDTIRKIVMRAVVIPRLVEDEGTEEQPLPAGTYSIANVGTKDRMAIFFAAIGEDMQKIEQFRAGPSGSVGTVESGEGVQHPSKPTSGNS